MVVRLRILVPYSKHKSLLFTLNRLLLYSSRYTQCYFFLICGNTGRRKHGDCPNQVLDCRLSIEMSIHVRGWGGGGPKNMGERGKHSMKKTT